MSTGWGSLRLLSFDELHRRLVAGDSLAADEFRRRYAPFIKMLAAREMGPNLRRQADPSDIAQSVLRVFLESSSRRAFPDDGTLRAWLRRVAGNKIARLARRATGPRHARFQSLPESPEDLADRRSLSPPELAVHAERIDRLKRALDLLPEVERTCIRLRDFEGREFPAIAGALQRPSPGAARQIYRRALTRLRRTLEDPGPDSKSGAAGGP